MPKQISHGACALCGAGDITKRAVLKHLEQCSKAIKADKDEKVFRLLITFPYDKRYWLYLEADESASLRHLDAFLRDIWLECCGHLSVFTIATREYKRNSMGKKLKDLLLLGMRCFYEYDFGSTTELFIDVLKQQSASKTRSKSIRLLARNESIKFFCSQCGKPATTICLECQEDIEDPDEIDKMFYCASCLDNKTVHKHDDEAMFSPVVNSPRMGVCGYTG